MVKKHKLNLSFPLFTMILSVMISTSTYAQNSSFHNVLAQRNLTELERDRLRENLSQLDQQAQILLGEGKTNEAFLLWEQELQLWQSLDKIEEIKALTRVGQIAWDQNHRETITKVNQRLEIIALDSNKLESATLKELGLAFATVKNRQQSLNIYQLLLKEAQDNNNIYDQEEALNKIGELHLNWFDYLQSAQTYEELLNISTRQNNPYTQLIYLNKLIYIYNQSFQPENALKIKQQLAQTYLENQDLEKLARIKIDMGSDYEILQKLEEASQIYQQAFTLAWGLRQLSVAGDALTKLAQLYQKAGYLDYALQIYQELIKVEQHSYNYFGLMNAYDQMGEIYRSQANYPQAIFLFQKALEIAQSLQYQQTYFQNKIQEIGSNQPVQ